MTAEPSTKPIFGLPDHGENVEPIAPPPVTATATVTTSATVSLVKTEPSSEPNKPVVIANTPPVTTTAAAVVTAAITKVQGKTKRWLRLSLLFFHTVSEETQRRKDNWRNMAMISF